MVLKTLKSRVLIGSAVLFCSVLAANAQTADSKMAAYQNVLQQIADKKLTIAQSEYFVSQQKAQIESLKSQLSGVKTTTGGVDVLLSKMAAQTEDAINSDLPFLKEERLNRIAKLKEDIAKSSLSVGDKYRSALSALKIEVNYGSSVESYEGERPVNQDEDQVIVVELDKDGNALKDLDGADKLGPETGTYLRYGRVALVYLSDDMTSARRYDLPALSWVDLSGDELLNVRKAVRMSRGEIAPAVVYAPAYITQ